MQPRTLALLVTILPFIGIHGAYLLSASSGLVEWCVPYLEGCTSISRAARRGDTIFFYRALMIPYATFLMVYWAMCHNWLKAQGATRSIQYDLMRIVGITGAALLILYTDFLGTQGDVYKFLRKFGVIFYFIFTALAQGLFLATLEKCPACTVSKRIQNLMLAALILLIVIGFSDLAIAFISPGNYEANNIVEWNFAAILHVFFFLSYFALRNSRFDFSDSGC
ncbi:MAG: hypothetical protein KDD53_06905 [Bdellovibrionales bacterium]|nr:hypothetical protein [Bdellovibrionales bacterium]